MSTLLRSNTRDRSGSPKFGHMHHRKQWMELQIERSLQTKEIQMYVLCTQDVPDYFTTC
jgi:hypothetical protein